jgi:hypothetical protein
MTVVVPAVFSMRCGLRGNRAVKWASWATSRYPAAGLGEDLGEDEGTARTITVAAIEPASRTIPATMTQRGSLRAMQAPRAAASLGHGDPVAAVGSGGAPGGLGRRAPARLRRPGSRIVLAIGRDRVIGARVQLLAAGRHQGAAHRLAAVAADPEPRWEFVVGGSGPVLARRHARVGCGVLDEPCGDAIVAWPAGQVGFLAVGLACLRLSSAR